MTSKNIFMLHIHGLAIPSFLEYFTSKPPRAPSDSGEPVATTVMLKTWILRGQYIISEALL